MQRGKSDAVSCASHTCTKTIDPEHSVYRTCGLCHEPMYCSEKCRLMDWPIHACDNVYEVADSLDKRGFATPYFYEDTLRAKDLDRLDVSNPVFNSYSVMHYNDNRKVSQSIVPRRVEFNAESSPQTGAKKFKGIPPNQFLKDGKQYALRVTVRSYDRNNKEEPIAHFVTGETTKDMIYPGNRADPKANQLAEKQGSDMVANQLVFWPHRAFLGRDATTTELVCEDKSDIDIDLYLMRPGEDTFRAKPDAYLHTGFNAGEGRKQLEDAGRLVQSNYAQNLHAKFVGDTTSAKMDKMFTRHYQDGAGNGVILTFEPAARSARGGNKFKIVDIEFLLPQDAMKHIEEKKPEDASSWFTQTQIASPFPMPIESQTYVCNLRDFDQVVGVSQAVDEILADAQNQALVETPFSDIELDRLTKAGAVIRDYAHKMEKQNGQLIGQNGNVPQDVETAVESALDTMYTHIGASVNVSYWTEKILSRDFSSLKKDVWNVINKMNKALKKKEASRKDDDDKKGTKVKKFFGRGISKAAMKKIMVSLNNLEKALNTFIQRLKMPDFYNGCDTALIEKYAGLREMVNLSRGKQVVEKSRYDIETSPDTRKEMSGIVSSEE